MNIIEKEMGGMSTLSHSQRRARQTQEWLKATHHLALDSHQRLLKRQKRLRPTLSGWKWTPPEQRFISFLSSKIQQTVEHFGQ